MIRRHWLSDGASEKHSTGFLGALGWGAFLGTSWTWVIGMILPALLIRDMGFAGFLAFAIPNCVGAAAMGTVLSRRQARDLPVKHWGMIVTFSIITVAYHFYIAGYLLPNLLGPISIIVFAVGAALAALFLFWKKDKGVLFYSGLIWVISIVCFLVAIISPETNAFHQLTVKPLQGAEHMWAFLPASIGGFVLCPYLDATFIRARAKTKGSTGRWAFAIGFLVIFAAMIVFTTAYAHEILGAFVGDERRLTGIWAILLTVHIPLQMGLTVTWHIREIVSTFKVRMENRLEDNKKVECRDCAKILNKLTISSFVLILLGCVAVFAGILVLGVTFKNIGFEWFADFKLTNTLKNLYEDYEMARYISLGEIGYRCLLICYGTLFPAYVMLMMVPTLVPSEKKRSWWLFAGTVVLSTATAYIGFVHAQPWAIAATLGVICIARAWLDFSAYRDNKLKSAR